MAPARKPFFEPIPPEVRLPVDAEPQDFRAAMRSMRVRTESSKSHAARDTVLFSPMRQSLCENTGA